MSPQDLQNQTTQQTPEQNNSSVAPPTSVVQPQQTQAINNSPPIKKTPTIKIILIVLGVWGGISLIMVGLFFVFMMWISKGVNNMIKDINSRAGSSNLETFSNPTTGEQWLDKPVKISNLNLLNDDTSLQADYYELGTRSENKIVGAVTYDNPMYANWYFFEQTTGSQYNYIANPILPGKNNTTTTSKDYGVISSVTVDVLTHYESLSPPPSFSVGEKLLTVSASYSNGDNQFAITSSPTFIDTSNTTKKEIAKFGKSKIIQVEQAFPENGLTAINYELEVPFGMFGQLYYEPIATNNLSKFRFDNGMVVGGDSSTNSPRLSPMIRGCGSAGGAVSRADKLPETDLKKIGVSDNGKDLYTITNRNQVLFKKAYEEYVDFQKENKEAPITADQFIAQGAIIVVKDDTNQWLVYTQDQFAPGGGCAKPVVYLYPEKQIEATVKVGADVKVSDPYYNPKNGWRVTAFPGGKLDFNNKTYNSLFWEGPGWGRYPSITAGLVVERSQVMATIKEQLKQQGLNNQEINDFIEYWQDNIPNKPYVRLTWFNTQQLEALAPLQVTPKPDTVIRVFLDMQGYDNPPSIPKQQLSNVSRKGFTVVEWGGLSHKKLY